MSSMSTGEVIADSLVAHGVDTVFGIPGAQADIGEHPQGKIITTVELDGLAQDGLGLSVAIQSNE